MWTRRRDAGAGHRGQHGARSLGVDPGQVGAAVEVARDGHQVDDGIDAGQRRRQRGRMRDVALAQLDAGSKGGGQAAEDGLAGRLAANQRHDAVAGGQQGRDGVAADEPAGTGHEDRGHGGRVASPP